jgi:HK97 family phage prohead protease
MRKVDDRKLVGMPIVYNRESEDMGFIEIIKPGAAKRALERSDVRVIYNHSDSLLPLGRMSAGTLRVIDTPEGVEIEVDPPDSQFGRDLMHAIERGDIQDMSFAFTVGSDQWETRNGKDYRIINEIGELFEFSYVIFPAYQDTTVALRSMGEYKTSTSDQSAMRAAAENDDIEIELLTIKAGEMK